MSSRSVNKSAIGSKTCYFCGRWPATLYRDLREKHSDRVCEFCVEDGFVIKNEDGIYVTNPEAPAATEESPDSDSHSSSVDEGAPDSAA